MKAVLHIDGDSFFASVEASLDPRLKGMPLVTGKERGIASSMSKEAKALGITRGMPVYKIKKLFPQVLIKSSDYTNYEIFAKRMYAIVRRYASKVEEYSIDECFATLDSWDRALVERIKRELQESLDVTFSLGLASTKVLAKAASSKNKPDGLTILEEEDIKNFLKDVPIGKIWGIGPKTSIHLQKLGVATALEFINKNESWISENLSKPYLLVWHELKGKSLYSVHSDSREEDDQKSIQCTRTFTPPSSDKIFLLSELSKNIEGACSRARAARLSAKRIYYFLKTQEFRYHRFEIPLDSPLSVPNKIISEVRKTFDMVYRPHIEYRATGVTLSGLIPEDYVQDNLFARTPLSNHFGEGVRAWNEVFKKVDQLDRRYGSHSVVLGSSLNSFKWRNLRPSRRLKIPYMGEVV